MKNESPGDSLSTLRWRFDIENATGRRGVIITFVFLIPIILSQQALLAMDKFRVRLNCIDHYQATPTRYDPPLHKACRTSNVSKEPRVPVIRIFGSTETGQKVCAHVHGVFPYLYVDYGGRGLEKSQGEASYFLCQ